MVTLPLGLAYLAEAVSRAGHEVRLVDLMRVADPLAAVSEAILAFQPQAIGLSVRNIDDQNMQAPRFLLDQAKEVVSLCREHSPAPVILGGAGYSIFPESALAYLGADMGLQGEGERTLPMLLDRLAGRKDYSDVPGLYLAGGGLQAARTFAGKLDALPCGGISSWFDPKGVDREAWMPVQTRRGCPMACSYCSTPAIEGKILRKRSPEAVAQGLAELMTAGFENFFFTDNTFNLPPAYARELCLALTRLNPRPRWRCILYPARLDETLVKDLARAGCREASLGFESGSGLILRRLNKRFTPQEIRLAIGRLADNGIRCQGFLLLGGPDETRESVEESLVFADSLPLAALKLTVGIRIYPATPLARSALKRGLISPAEDLLRPRFYLEPGLEEWLPETVRDWADSRPNWIC